MTPKHKNTTLIFFKLRHFFKEIFQYFNKDGLLIYLRNVVFKCYFYEVVEHGEEGTSYNYVTVDTIS